MPQRSAIWGFTIAHGACERLRPPEAVRWLPHASSVAPLEVTALYWHLIDIGSSFVPLHGFNAVVNVAIAIAKAALVAVIFMRLRTGTPLVRLVAIAGVVWLMILTGLSLTDFLSRP